MLQILGICRFAYPGLGMFQVEHDSVEARQAHLWTPERMEARFRTLEHICLRTLALQTDQDFKLLILTGDQLPEPYRSRLLDLAKMVPSAKVVFHPAKQQQHALTETILPMVDPNGPPICYFRQDDDDGVALRFVARCREIFADTQGLFERYGRLCIDFNRGYRINITGDTPRVQHLSETHLGVAQAIILRADNKRSGMHFPHHRIATLMPAVSMPNMPMWLRGVDATNDSRVSNKLDLLKPATPEEQNVLRKRFGLDLGAIRNSF